jgi:diguanylate cyclase (GGDEF)-like protein
MRKFEHLHTILEHTDSAFKEFYDSMLSDSRLKMFFKSDEQIVTLIERQKQNFVATLGMSAEELKENYIKLGEFHYDISIPYVDFIKGSEMLQRYFMLHITQADLNRKLANDIFDYFALMKSYTAKGYLNRMVAEDKKDMEEFFEHSKSNEDVNFNSTLVFEKIEWLRNLLDMLESGRDDLEYEDVDVYEKWISELQNIPSSKRAFLQDLERRIILNTKNLFYFLKNEEYLEILPLYTSLLSIYKLTLMLNNAITVEYANKAIDNLKIDSMTGLFRKETFVELLDKEMIYANREEGYKFSLAYLDFDNFKNVNDTYGHYSGDKVIEKFGEIIKASIRGSDLGFRIGGDEFAIIFKNTSKEMASRVCEKIKSAFGSFEFKFNEEISFRVSISVGVTEYDKECKCTHEELIKLADDKLYISKSAGRDEITL